MVAKHDQKIVVEKEGKKKPATTKQLKSKPVKEKSIKPTPAPKPKGTQVKPVKPSPAKHSKLGKVLKTHKGKSSLQLIDEDEPTQPEPKHQSEGDEYDVEGKVIATEEQAAQSLLALHTPKRRRTTNQFIFQRRTPATEEASTGPSAQPQDDASANIVHESPSPTDAETGVDTDKTNSEGDTEILQIDEEQGKDVDNQVNLKEKTIELDQGQARSDPGKTPESRPSPEQNHYDAYTIRDHFLNDKSTEDEPGKLNVEAKVVSMVTVPIYQASFSVPPLCTPVIDLSPSKPKSQKINNTTQNLGSRVFTLELWDLPYKLNQAINAVVKESGSYKSLPEHVSLYEALDASMDRANRDEFLAKKDKSRKRRRDDQDPPPLPDSSSKQQSVPHQDQLVKDVPMPDDVNILDLEDTDTAHLPKIKTRTKWLRPLPNEDRPATSEPDWIIPPTDSLEAKNNWVDALAKSYKDPEENKLLSQNGDMGSFIKWFCNRIGKKKLRNCYLEGPTFKVVKAFQENDMSLQFQMEECHWLLINQVDLVNPEGHRLVPDVSKLLPIGGPPGQPAVLLIGGLSVRISASIDTTPHLIVVQADYNEYKISKSDFKNLHLNDFEDLYLLHLQGKLNHIYGSDKFHLYNAINLWIMNIVIRQRVGDLQLGIEIYQTTLNLMEPRWDTSDFLFKEDYTIISKLRAVIYRDRNDRKKMLRENEVHKFSDGTLTRVLHKLDHMVKDFRLYQYNPSMEYRIWSEDDKRRSEDFMEYHGCGGIEKVVNVSSKSMEASFSDPVPSTAGFDFGNPESYEDEVFDPSDELASYMPSSCGGFQLEGDGYEA
uniref:Uncharacterized protein n=1 Tax=Tanacetum cinerariifolium TaxID=118510 RepID=A0A6L2KWK8_TANCI|nr:hypothetical protein [Tanacetum cinerariifolium]